MEKASQVTGTILLFALVFAACSALGNEPEPNPEQSTVVNSAVPPSQTAVPTATELATVAPAITQSSTPTDTPTEIPPSPTATFTPTPLACWQEGGKIEDHLLYTEISPLPWEFRIYTPPCYDQQTDRHYPLLILIHGSTFNDDQWDRLGADETADRLIANGTAAPFLILMPRDRVWVEPTEDPFGEALVDYLLPWVEANYRSIPEKKYRAIGGLSRGASWAVHLGLSRSDLFGAIGGHSLPVFATDPPRLKTWLGAIPRDQLPRFFLDIGENDYLLEHALWFENLLTELDIPHEWYLFPGRHEEAYWQAHLEQYLIWYTAEW